MIVSYSISTETNFLIYLTFIQYFNQVNRASRYSKINLDIVLSYLNIQDNNRYNIYIQFAIQYQDCGDKNVKNLVLKIN